MQYTGIRDGCEHCAGLGHAECVPRHRLLRHRRQHLGLTPVTPLEQTQGGHVRPGRPPLTDAGQRDPRTDQRQLQRRQRIRSNAVQLCDRREIKAQFRRVELEFQPPV